MRSPLVYFASPSLIDALASPYSAELKEKLNQAEDTNRQLALRKEIEGKTFQERIDKLVSPLSSQLTGKSH